MCQLMVKQDRFLGNLRTGIARNNAVALNALLPNAGAIALLGHPTVIAAKKKLLQLYYQRALGVALVEYLETANAHKGRIDEILTAAEAEGMFHTGIPLWLRGSCTHQHTSTNI